MTIETFKEIASDVQNSYIKDFKNSGGKIIGVSYSRVPVFEVYHAAGLLGVRLRANEISSTSIGDTYYGPVICSFPKGLLQMAGEGKYKFLDGLITSTLCDSMRRLDENWRKAATDIEGIMPGFHRLFAVPHKTEDFSLEWFTEELRLHIDEIEKHFQVTVETEALRESIKQYNKARSLLRKFDEIRSRPKVPISGADALTVFVAANAIPIEAFIDLLEKLLAELEATSTGIEDKRLFMVGSANDDPEFVQSIEELGAVVVGDMMSFGSKFYENMVDEDDSDPVAALARSYLLSLKHPRMAGEYKSRLEFLRKKIADCKADGVILQNIRFCDFHGCENSIYERDLEAAGVPCMKLEREYGPLVETGRVKMRAQAFLERISK